MKNTVNTQEITITNACTATAIGNVTHGNRKPVLCITTGETFASVTDAAKHYNIIATNISAQIRGVAHRKTVGGLKFCFVSKTQEHYDEITQQMRDTTTVIMPKQVVKVPVPAPVKEEKETFTVAKPIKQYGWFRTYLINIFKKFVVALEA